MPEGAFDEDDNRRVRFSNKRAFLAYEYGAAALPIDGDGMCDASHRMAQSHRLHGLGVAIIWSGIEASPEAP